MTKRLINVCLILIGTFFITPTTIFAHQTVGNDCFHPQNQYVECCGDNYCSGADLVNDCETYYYTGPAGFPTDSANHAFHSSRIDPHISSADQCTVCTPDGSCSALEPSCPDSPQTFGTDNCGNTCSRTATCAPPTYSVSGKVYLRGATTKPIPEVKINNGQPSPVGNGFACNIGVAETKTDGTYTISGIPQDLVYCVRPPTTNPAGFNNPQATNPDGTQRTVGWENIQATENKTGVDFTYTAVCPAAPSLTNPSVTCTSTQVPLSWNYQSSAIGGYDLRVEDGDGGIDTVAYWNDTPPTVINNTCTAHDVCLDNLPQAATSVLISVAPGRTYSWWLHARGGLYCGAPSAGTQFTVPSCATSTSISASPSTITKDPTTGWPQLAITYNTNDSNAARISVCKGSSGDTDCSTDNGWTDIFTSVTKDGSPHTNNWTPPSFYTVGDYYFAVYPASTPRLAKSNKVTFVNPALFDFTVSNPGDANLVKGSTDPGRTTTVTTTAGTPESVTLSLVGSIGGAVASFSPASCTPSSPSYTCNSTLTFNTSSATPGTYLGLKVRGTTAGGTTRDSATFTLTITAPSPCTNTTPGTNQLKGCLFDGINLIDPPVNNAPDGLLLSSLISSSALAFNTNWGAGSPNATLVGSDTYSMRWKGNFTFAAGTYTFYTESDDGSRVFFSGGGFDNTIPIVNSWSDHGPVRVNSNAITLSNDTAITVTLEYYENSGNALAKFGWDFCPGPSAAGAFDYSLTNSGPITVTAGSSGSNSITANLSSTSAAAPYFIPGALSNYSTYSNPTSGTATSSVSSFTVPKPAGVTTGDVLLAYISVHYAAPPTIKPDSTNQCWRLIHALTKYVGGYPGVSSAIYWKPVGTSEPASYKWNFDSSAHGTGVILGYRNTSSINAENGQGAQTTLVNSSNTISTPSITTTATNTTLLTFFTIQGYIPTNQTPISLTGPTGMTPQYADNGDKYFKVLVSDLAQSTTTTVSKTATTNVSGLGTAEILALSPPQSSSSQNVTLSILSGLPQGATSSFPLFCFPTCSRTLTITTASSTPATTYPITVTGSPLDRLTNFNLIVQSAPISAPTISIPNSCINSGYSGSGVTISWSSLNNPGVTWVNISTDSAFGSYYHKDVTGLTSTTAPNGFNLNPSDPPQPLTLNPDTPYYVRTFNGTTHSPTAFFNIPACLPGPFSQSIPQAKCSATFSPYVDLAWGTSVNASSYRILRNLTAIATVNASQTTYRDASVTAATLYSYLIRAINSAGTTDSDSGTAKSVTTLICYPWIQTEGGDVHSNTNINTPGGP